MARLHIIIDTREQTPWAFDPGSVDASIGTLQTGDYALAGDLNFGIERKSLGDFIGTIGKGWERFKRELGRMDTAKWHRKIIIVEADYASCFFYTDPISGLVGPQHNGVMMTPQFVRKRITDLVWDHDVHVEFTGNAFLAAGHAVAHFRKRQNQIEQNTKS